MGLSELLKEHSVQSISQKTMISEENIKDIVSEDYSRLTKAKALGFLSILQREYQLDLKDVRNNAVSYFEIHRPEEDAVNIALPRVEEKRGRSKWFVLIILGLFGYASWYFFTQFDKKTLNTFIPSEAEQNKAQKKAEDNRSIFPVAINEETSSVVVAQTVASNATESPHDSVRIAEDISVPTVETKHIETKPAEITVSNITVDNNRATFVSVEQNATTETDTTVEKNITTVNSEKPKEVTTVVLRPVKRLWFGLINMRTGKKDHFSVRKPFTINLSQGNWLMATSPAPFSLVFNNTTNMYKNGRAHYFMITKEGITPLKKRAYVKKGGYIKWVQ